MKEALLQMMGHLHQVAWFGRCRDSGLGHLHLNLVLESLKFLNNFLYKIYSNRNIQEKWKSENILAAVMSDVDNC